jgi:hypothetical protein
MICLACQEREHDCCDNHLFPGICACGCVWVLDPPPLRSNLLIIMGSLLHDPHECVRQVRREKYHREYLQRRAREASRRAEEVA